MEVFFLWGGGGRLGGVVVSVFVVFEGYIGIEFFLRNVLILGCRRFICLLFIWYSFKFFVI